MPPPDDNPAIRHEDYFHTGIVVHDFDAAQVELGDALGVTWAAGGEMEVPVVLADGGARTIAFRYAYSEQGPPYLELVRGTDTLWTPSGAGQAHHLGYWASRRPRRVAAPERRRTAAGRRGRRFLGRRPAVRGVPPGPHGPVHRDARRGVARWQCSARRPRRPTRESRDEGRGLPRGRAPAHHRTGSRSDARAGQVVLEVGRCGICGSDLSMTSGVGMVQMPPGWILGHEFAGEVVALGPGVESRRLGDRLTALAVYVCRRVLGLSRRSASVVHGHGSDRVHRRVRGVRAPRAPTVSWRCRTRCRGPMARSSNRWPWACTACTSPTCARARKVLVLGAGPIGLAAVYFALADGCRDDRGGRCVATPRALRARDGGDVVHRAVRQPGRGRGRSPRRRARRRLRGNRRVPARWRRRSTPSARGGRSSCSGSAPWTTRWFPCSAS